jgi:hypothetical protein
MSEKTRFWILLALLVLVISLAALLNSELGQNILVTAQ